MRQFFSLVFLHFFANIVSAQSYKLTMSDEIKLKKNTSDIEIISADNTGLYFTASRVKMTGYYVFSATYGLQHQLIKFDKNYNEVFRKDYKKELKGVEFNGFKALGNDIFLFATDYVRKGKQFKVYGAKINKDNGDLEQELAELGSFDLESSKDEYNMRLKPVRNGKNLLLVADISSKDHLTLGVSLLNNALVKSSSSVITLPYTAAEFTLEDVMLTKNDKIITLGRQYEQIETGKKKKKTSVFKQYQMLVYNIKGQKEKDINLDAGNRYVIGGKMIEQKEGGILLAGFYSNSSKKDLMNGFFINKVDDIKTELQLTSYKEINSEILNRKPEQDSSSLASADSGDLSSQYVIRSIDINPVDNSIVITSEVSAIEPYSYTRSSYTNGRWDYSTYTGTRFYNRDMLIINTDSAGKIRWINDIPKAQLEEVESRSRNGGFSDNAIVYFFGEDGGMPFYSSFKSVINKNKLVLIFNDDEKNWGVTKYGQYVVKTNKFKNSVTYGLSVDLVTGEMQRKKISTNDDETVLTPRHGYLVNNEFIIPSLRTHLLAKSQVKFARIAIIQK